MKKIGLALALLMVVGITFPNLAHAELRVDVTKGTMDPIPVAVTQFVPKDSAGAQFATDIPQVISNDLASTGLFRLVDPASFIQDAASMQTQIRFNE